MGRNMFGVRSTAFSADGSRLASGSTGIDSLNLWDVRTFERLLTLGAKAGAPGRTEFSSDGNVIVVDGSRILCFWRAPSWAETEKAEAAERAGGKP